MLEPLLPISTNDSGILRVYPRLLPQQLTDLKNCLLDTDNDFMDLYNRLQDKSIILRINQHFYEQVYAQPWLSQYFQAVTKEFITQQQTDFIIGAIGGPKLFCGRLPSNAHPHMFISNELFDLRKSLLQRSFEELQAPLELQEAWLRIDEAFRHVIVKSSKDECKGRWPTDEILDFQDPAENVASAVQIPLAD